MTALQAKGRPTMPHQLRERFLRYVKIHTTSDPYSKTYPSTERQWDLLRLLKNEQTELGAQDVVIT